MGDCVALLLIIKPWATIQRLATTRKCNDYLRGTYQTRDISEFVRPATDAEMRRVGWDSEPMIGCLALTSWMIKGISQGILCICVMR